MRAFMFAALMLAGCASAPAGGAAPDTSQLPQHIREDLAQREAALAEPGIVVAAIGQNADLGGGLRVRPLEVLEDSRCPQNARCVWAGRLRVRVNIDGVGEREVTLGEGTVETPHGAFALAAVTPGPWTDLPQGAVPYRFGFRKV